MGHAKWAVPIALMAGGCNWATRLGGRLHRKDLLTATSLGPAVWRCLQVAMSLRKREAPITGPAHNGL